jgi:hypothetical protein
MVVKDLGGIWNNDAVTMPCDYDVGATEQAYSGC